MSRFLAATLAIVFSLAALFGAYNVNSADLTIPGGAFIAMALTIPVFAGSWALQRLGFRWPRVGALVVALILCALTLHPMGVVAWAILAAFTGLQFTLRNSRAFRLRHTA